MRGRRLLGGVLAGFIVAAIGLVGFVVWSGQNPNQVFNNPSTQLVSVTRNLNAGQTIQNGDWQGINSTLPPATAALYFTPLQRSLFLGKTLVRPLQAGNLLAKDGDLLTSTNTDAVVPVKFQVTPETLQSGDSLCIYAIASPGVLRIFYLTPLVVTASGQNWQATVPSSKAPYFLYAAVNMSLAAFGSTNSGVCPSIPIFSSTQAIEGATGTTVPGP